MAEAAALEAALTRTALAVPVPQAEAFARAVGERLRTEPASPPASPWRRPALVAIAAAVILALVVALLPPARRAVADFLGIGGVRISSVPATTAPPGTATTPAPTTTFQSTPADPFAGLGLGRPLTLDEARAAVDLAVKVPTAAGYTQPDAVYLGTGPPGGMVSLVYAPAVGRPATPVAPVGVLLSEFRAVLDPSFAKKLISPETKIDFVTVDGDEALWISGPVHEFVYTRPDGTSDTERLRLAANTLLWVHDGITYRLESALDRDMAIALALTLR